MTRQINRDDAAALNRGFLSPLEHNHTRLRHEDWSGCDFCKLYITVICEQIDRLNRSGSRNFTVYQPAVNNRKPSWITTILISLCIWQV